MAKNIVFHGNIDTNASIATGLPIELCKFLNRVAGQRYPVIRESVLRSKAYQNGVTLTEAIDQAQAYFGIEVRAD